MLASSSAADGSTQGGRIAPVAPVPDGLPPKLELRRGSKGAIPPGLPPKAPCSGEKRSFEGIGIDRENEGGQSLSSATRTASFVPTMKSVEVHKKKLMRGPDGSFGLLIGGLFGRFDRVVKVVPNSIAESVGMRPFDRIFKVNGVSATGRDVVEIVKDLNSAFDEREAAHTYPPAWLLALQFV